MSNNSPRARKSYRDPRVQLNERRFCETPNTEMDELDGNTMSKPMRMNDITNNQNLRYRQYHLKNNQEPTDDEDDISDFDDDANTNNDSNTSFAESSMNKEQDSHSSDGETKSNLMSSILTCFIILIIAVVVNFDFWGTKEHNDVITPYSFKNFQSDIETISQKYDLDNTLLLTAIREINKKENAGSLMFVYNLEKNRNIGELNNLVKSIAQATVKYFRNESMVDKLPYKNGYTLLPHNEVDLINYYRQSVNDTGAMVVLDISKIPHNQAQMFHHFCDEYNPVVKKSAIFFTLDLRDCSTNADVYHKNPINVIERCLHNKWRDMNSDLRAALLTRVVDVIINIS